MFQVHRILRFAGLAGAGLAAVCAAAEGQDLRTQLDRLGHQAWSTEEGLPQSSVHSILQTQDGYLWVATEAGLARFDAVGFRVFDSRNEPAMVSDDLCCLAEEPGNTLWIGTADGVVRLQQGQMQRFGEADGMASGTVLSVQAEHGVVLVETTGAWSRWDGHRFSAVAGPVDAGVSLAGPDGAEWHYTAEAVTMRSRGAVREWHVGKELPSGRIATVLVDRAGLAWVGMNHGLFVVDGERVEPVTQLQGSSVLSLYEDAEGDHWVGTETSGLHVLRRLMFHAESALAGAAVTAVVQTGSGEGERAMWVGTRDDGVRERVRGAWQPEMNAPALTSSVVLCMAPAADGDVWVGTPDGLNLIDGATKKVLKITSADGLPDDAVRSLAADPDGSVWVGTRHGLAHLRLHGNEVEVQMLTSASGLGGDLIGALLLVSAKDAKTLWVGTSTGLSRISSGGKITNFTTKDGLGSAIVTALGQDRGGDIWAATDDGGLALFDGQRFRAAPNEVWQRNRANKVEAIVSDAGGDLWLRMDRGVRRGNALRLHACVLQGRCNDVAIASYGPAAGMPNDEVVPGGPVTAWVGDEGEVWLPSRGGVAVVDTNDLPASHVAPPVMIESFLVDDSSRPLDGSQIAVPYGNSRLTMEYAGLSFLAPGEVRYRFMLDGFDKHWTDAGTRRSATYTNLPPGEYVFRVQAMGNGGGWSEPGAMLRFRVVPPFYRRWWFVVLMVLLAAVVLAGLYLLRLRVVRRRFEAVLAERNRMAREIHDTLTQDFVGTSLQLDILQQLLKSGKVETAMEQVKQTRQLVTDGLEEARRSIWELRANNSQDSLPTRLARLLERDAFATLAPKLELGGAYRALDPRTEREVLRIAQEALTNVMRHAHATETKVSLRYYNEALRLEIEDDGRGFLVADGMEKDGHFGLLGMKERAAAIGGTLDIASEPDVSSPKHGTTLTLHLPLDAAKRS